MAKGPRVTGQVFETPQDVKEKQYDLLQNLEQDAPAVPTEEAKGQDVPLSEAELTEMFKLPVKELGVTPQDQLGAAVATSQAVEQQEGSEVGLTDAATATVEAATEEVDLTPEQEAQRESERVATLFESNGLAVDLSNMSDQLGPVTGSRLSSYMSTPVSVDVVNLKRSTADKDPSAQIGTPEFEAILEAEGKAEVDAATEKPMMMRKDDSSLVLSPQNIFTSNKVLGKIAVRNPDEESFQKAGIHKRFNPLIAMVVESFMVEQDIQRQKQSEVSLEEDDAFSPTEAERADVSMARLGRDSFQHLRRAAAQIEGKPTDEYVQDFRNLTPEAFELIGKSIMAYYQGIAPRMVEKVNTGSQGGESQYVLTPYGRDILEQEAGNYRVPDFNKQFLYVPPTEGQYEYEGSLIRSRSGANPNQTPTLVQEGKHNASQVKSYLDVRRSSIYVSLLAAGIATNPVARQGESNFTHNLTEQGPERIQKIVAIGSKQAARKEANQLKIEDIDAKLATNPTNANQLIKQKAALLQENEALEELRVKFTPLKVYMQEPNANPKYIDTQNPQNSIAGSMLKPTYYSFVGKYLEVGSMMSNYSGKPFYHTFNEQSGTHRLNAIQTNSFQTNHAMRNIIGSGVKYVIKPGSNTTQERALLRGFGQMFFGADGYMAEGQLKAARDNIRLESPRYKAIVNLGEKLINMVGELNPRQTVQGFKGLKVTQRGINGIDGITDTKIIELIEADADLKGLFESLSKQSDSHKHSIQLLDYMMALADYHRSRKEGKPFHSSVNAVEIDGISNGLTTMQAMLGNINAMYRGGVLRAEGEERVLGIFDDVEGAEAFAGKLRDSLKVRMAQLLDGSLGALTIMGRNLKKKYEYDEEHLPLVNEMVSLAIADSSGFLKPPLMTFPYGQELHNLVGSARDTILDPKNSELKQLAEEFGGVTKAAEFLNEVREPALIETLGADLVEFAKLAKLATNASAMYGLGLETVSPAGGTITFGGKATMRTGKEQKFQAVRTRERQGGQEATKATLERMLDKARADGNESLVAELEARLGSPTKGQVTVAQKEKVFDPTAERGGRMGAVASGQILPSLAQSVDGSTIAQLFSNESMAGLRNEIGGDPYILPIFDAVITDLGSFEAVERKINQIFYRNVTQAKMLDKLAESLSENLKAGNKVYRDLARSKGKEVIDEVFDGGVADMVVDLLEKNKKLIPKADFHIKRLKQVGKTPNPQRTYTNLREAQNELENTLFAGLERDFIAMVKEAKARNKQLEAKVKAENQRIMQYEMDPGINVDFLGSLPPVE